MEKCIFFVLFLVCLSLQSTQAAIVKLYESSNFNGANKRASHNISMSESNRECINLPHAWNNKVSSVNTDDLCLDLYVQDNCQGSKITLYPGTTHTDMSDWLFNNALESLRVCEEQLSYKHENRHSILIHTESGQFHLNVIKCRNIPQEILKRMMKRIDTYGVCYKYYSRFGCTGLIGRSTSPVSDERFRSAVSIERCETVTTKGTTTTTEATMTPDTDYPPYPAGSYQLDQSKSQNSQLFNYINDNYFDNSTYEIVSNVKLNDTSRSALHYLFGKTLSRPAPYRHPIVLLMYPQLNQNQRSLSSFFKTHSTHTYNNPGSYSARVS